VVKNTERHGDIEMDFWNHFNRGRGSMLNRLKMLGAMGSIFGSMFGMGMGGDRSPQQKTKGVGFFSAKEYARRKKRQKMARMSRRRNRWNRKVA